MNKKFSWKEARELALKILYEAEERRLKFAQDEANRINRLLED